MTTFTTITNALVAVGAKPFASTMQALRDNPISIAEGDPTAPVNQAFWHPYNKVTVGDANNGMFYDFGTMGAAASVETPVFEAGYDYRVRLLAISHNNGAATDFRLEMRRQSSGLYNPAATLVTAATNALFFSGQVIMEGVGVTNNVFFSFPYNLSQITGANAALTGNQPTISNQVSVAQRLDRARLSWAAGSIDNGIIYLDRKRAVY